MMKIKFLYVENVECKTDNKIITKYGLTSNICGSFFPDYDYRSFSSLCYNRYFEGVRSGRSERRESEVPLGTRDRGPP